MYLEVYFPVSLYKYTGNIRIDLLIFLCLVTLAVEKTLLEVVICEFLKIIIYLFSHLIVIFLYYYYYLFYYFFLSRTLKLRYICLDI